jgi:hypothetical protein
MTSPKDTTRVPGAGGFGAHAEASFAAVMRPHRERHMPAKVRRWTALATRTQLRFPDAAREVMTEMGVSQRGFARRMALSQTHLIRMLRGEHCTPEMAQAAGRATGLLPGYFVEEREGGVQRFFDALRDDVFADPQLRDELYDLLQQGAELPELIQLMVSRLGKRMHDVPEGHPDEPR